MEYRYAVIPNHLTSQFMNLVLSMVTQKRMKYSGFAKNNYAEVAKVSWQLQW